MGAADAEYAFKQLLSSQHESIWEILKGQYLQLLASLYFEEPKKANKQQQTRVSLNVWVLLK